MKLVASLMLSTLSAYALLFLSLVFSSGNALFGLSYSNFCLLCSGLWLLRTMMELSQLLDEYVDTRKQRRLKIAITFGTAAALLSMAPLKEPLMFPAAVGVLCSWITIISCVIATHTRFRKVERGLVPKETWIDPPADVFQPGDVIGTTGVWWEPHHQAFAHCELVSYTSNSALISNKAMSEEEWQHYLNLHKGRPLCASSCSMEYGTYLHSCQDVLQNCLKQTHLKEGHERWFCARLTDIGRRDLEAAWGPNWQEKLTEFVDKKAETNKLTRRMETRRRQRIIKNLPLLSQRHKDYLCELVRASGYNWCKMLFADTEELVSHLRKLSPRVAWFIFGNTTSDESDLCSTHVISTISDDLKLKTRPRFNFTPYGFGNPVLPVEVILLKSASGEAYYRLLDLKDKQIYDARKQLTKNQKTVAG